MTGTLYDTVKALLASGEKARAQEVLHAAQNNCEHEYGAWVGVGGAQRTCKRCGHVERDG